MFWIAKPLRAVAAAAVALGVGRACAAADPFTESGILELMRRANRYVQEHPYRETDRNWVRATWYSGVMEAYHATGDPAYLDQALRWAEKHEWQVGEERLGLNRLFCAMTWLELYLLDPDAKKIAPTIEALEADLPYAPKLGRVWYGYARRAADAQQVYADALYGAPALAMLHRATGQRKYLEWLHDAFWTVTEKLLDREADLFYRDASYIGARSPNGRNVLWSRGNGWVLAGLPRILKHLPKDDPYYDRYVDLYRRMARSLASRQGDDGFWRANLDDPWEYPMPESSGTAFFVAGFAMGVRQGVLDRDAYLPVIIRGWNALARAVHPDGRLGWVQPIDARPRPSHPRSTHEYAVGALLTGGGQVYLLVRDRVITPEKVRAALGTHTDLLPPAALKPEPLTARDHPLSEAIQAFLERQASRTTAPTGLAKRSYLDVIAGQVRAARRWQDAEGRIMDPVEKVEKYYATPCYARSVAALAAADYPIGQDLLESGMRALDVALKDLAAGSPPGRHGDFYTWPAVQAFEELAPLASQRRKNAWRRRLEQIDPQRAYRAYRRPVDPSDHRGFYASYGPDFANNWNIVNAAGEWARTRHGLGDPWYVDYCLTMQLANFSAYGMYRERGDPLPYDLFARRYLTGMLRRGYRSFPYATYRDLLWRGAWTSLLMQSPCGELPTGYRSSHHIWNEAEQAAVFETYASAYARAGRMAEAGAFKRAARLALASILDWIRPDGSGYIVKNRYPIEARHGYEAYSAHSCYNMLACSMLAEAWRAADDGIGERPCPADVGGFVFTVPNFHKVFANAGGAYLEYDTEGDQKYNPTGLLRIHFRDGDPQLGPSDGCAPYFSGEGCSLAVGPAWKDRRGRWRRLAEQTGRRPAVDVRQAAPECVQFSVTYRFSGPAESADLETNGLEVRQTFTVKPREVLVEDSVRGAAVGPLRIDYPVLVFDGENRTDVRIDGPVLSLKLRDKGLRVEMLDPPNARLVRSKQELHHRNGIVEPVYWEVAGRSARYRIRVVPERSSRTR